MVCAEPSIGGFRRDLRGVARAQLHLARRYEGWHALRKLRYVDESMAELKDAVPRSGTGSASSRSDTIATHCGSITPRASLFRSHGDDALRREVRRVFCAPGAEPGPAGGRGFLRQVRPELQRLLVRRSRLHPYLVHHVMRRVIRRARELDLCVHQPLR